MNQHALDNHAWFTAVATENYRLFFSIAYRVLRSSHAAEDAVQTGLVKAWENLGTLDGRDGAVPWLARIVKNAALDMTRKGGKTTVRTAGDGLASFANRADDNPGQTIGEDEMAVLHEAIDELPDTQSIVITLRHMEGLNIQEIANRLDLQPNTVRVRVFRAYAKLRENPRVQRALGMDRA